MLRRGSHQYNFKRNMSLVFLILFKVSTADMSTWFAPGFLIVQEKATKNHHNFSWPSVVPSSLTHSVILWPAQALLRFMSPRWTTLCEQLYFHHLPSRQTVDGFFWRLKTLFPNTINGGILWFPQKHTYSFAFIVGNKCPKENSRFSCFHGCWHALFETAHSAASAFDRIYSLGEEMSSQADTRAGLH